MRLWSWWPPAFAASLTLCALTGWLTPLGIGNAIFTGGILAIATSLVFIRLGGGRTRVGRDIDGKPQWGIDKPARDVEIARGMFAAALALALWSVLLIAYVLGVTF